MFQKVKFRFFICLALVAVVFFVGAGQLYELTVTQGGELSSQSDSNKQRTIPLKGNRGQITDVNGVPLAYDQTSYNVEFTRDPSRSTTTDRAYYTNILIQAIGIIEESGASVIDSFNIKRNADGTFYFDFGITAGGEYTEEDVAKRETNWRENMFVSKTDDPDVIYRYLRNRYRIPEDYTYEQALPLLSIWQEVQLSSYRAYVPVTIASGIDIETVSVIEARTAELDGIGVSESSVRVYPKDDVAAHIIGYTGRIDEARAQEMKDKGYSTDDTMGVVGVESTMEAALTGNSTERQGQRNVIVNSQGKVVQELSYTPATAGSDVVLTIDLDLQMKLEEVLQANVEQVYDYRMQEYEKLTPEKQELYGEGGVSQAKTGAAVVMDPNTGRVLAMASYPSYDLNLFSGGIDQKDMDMLTDDISKPLFNNAVSSKGIPGSIFKMVTGMGGLMEGAITTETRISDAGPFDKFLSENASETERQNAPSCWLYRDLINKGALSYDSSHDEIMSQMSAHGSLNLKEALTHSCNYFFYTVATQEQMGEERLSYWAEQFGLTTLTGVEVTGEVAGQVGSQASLYDASKPISEQKTSLPNLIQVALMDIMRGFGEAREIEYTDDELKQAANRLMELVGTVDSSQRGDYIRAILFEELGIPETVTNANGWTVEISQRLTELTWSQTRTATAAIGADITAVTPIAVARYVSALVNGGYVYEAHVVDSIVDAAGNVEKREPQVFAKIDAPDEYFNAIKDGMQGVVDEEGGSARDTFADFKEKGYTVGGKTGTGQVSKLELQNNAWFVAFTPFEDAEIVVVVYLPNGVAGSNAAQAAHDIMDYYLAGQQEQEEAPEPAANTILT